MPNKTYKIFLASSSELEEDREHFKNFLYSQTAVLQKKDIFVELDIWEDMGDAVSKTRKQDDYNEEIKECDIFIVLYWTKMGKYTNEEFDMALTQFRLTRKKPKIYIYEKTAAAPGPVTDKDNQSLVMFKEKLRDIQHFPTQFDNHDELENLFRKNLDDLFMYGFLRDVGSRQYEEIAECLYTDGNSVPVNFIGRDEELRAIKEKLNTVSSMVLINADGGIGKTSLAAKYWDESLYNYKYNAWLFCENGIVQEIKKLATKLHVELGGLNEEQQIEALKIALLGVSKDFLLVLDNADKDKDIEHFKETFRGFYWHVIITSRRRGILEEKQELPIVHLPPPLAKELFISNYKENTPEFDSLLDRLLAAIDYHTLLVEIFSKNMKHLRAFKTLADFLKQLETNDLFLGEDSFSIITDYTNNVHKEAKNTDEIISILYDFNKVSEPERYQLVNLALLPAVNYELVFLFDIFNPENKRAFRDVLQTLVEKGWLSNEENGYRMSPVVQKLVLQKNSTTIQNDSEELIDHLNEELDNIYITNFDYKSAASFAQLVPTITKHFGKQPSNELGILNERTCIFYLETGDLLEAQKAAENYRKINEILDNQLGLSISYSRLGEVYTKLGDFEKSLDFSQKYNDLSTLLYEETPGNVALKDGLAISYQNLGIALSDLEKWEKALDFFQKYNKLEKELCEDYPDDTNYKNSLAISYQYLGTTYTALNDLENALDYYQKYNELEKELYEAHPDNANFQYILAISYQYLGKTYAAMDKLENASDYYQKYNDLEKPLCEKYPDNVEFKNALALSYYYLGNIYEKNKDKDSAISHYSHAVELYEQLVITSPQNADFIHNLKVFKERLQQLELDDN